MFVYKVMGNFTNENFKNKLFKIQNDFKFMYKNNSLYMSVLNYEQNINKNVLNELRTIFTPDEEFLVVEITEKNIMKEEPTIREWCRDCLVENDRKKYEYEKQGKLKDVMRAMDIMEDILYKQYQDAFNNKNNCKNNSKNNNKNNNKSDNKNNTVGKED